jgi:nucleotide-binding universal stress UspA family protein
MCSVAAGHAQRGINMSNSFAYKRIVVGTALRYSGYPAVLRAVNRADRTDGAVTVVHAVEEGGARTFDGETISV